MFTSNPFAELAASIPPAVMQTYVVVMIVLVAAGTLFDIVHKGSAKYFFANWRKSKSKGSQQVEWAIHAPLAANAGIAADTIAAIAKGRRPSALTDDETLVYDFCFELNVNQDVSDAIFDRALARFGEQGVVDLLGTNGYYTLLAMVMNGARTAPAESTGTPLPPLPPRTWFAA